MSTFVPAPPVGRAIDGYLKAHPDITDEAFIEEYEMQRTTFYNLRNDRQKMIRFKLADRILSGIGRVDLWFNPLSPLYEAYQNVDLTRYEDWELALLQEQGHPGRVEVEEVPGGTIARWVPDAVAA